MFCNYNTSEEREESLVQTANDQLNMVSWYLLDLSGSVIIVLLNVIIVFVILKLLFHSIFSCILCNFFSCNLL